MNFEEKLNILNEKAIKSGAHVPKDDDMCAMEAVAWLAGEQWSDKPECACPAISAFVRNWNESISSDETRTRLMRPLIPRLLNTRSTKAVEQRRSWMAVDWEIRTRVPSFLRLVPAFEHHAKALELMPAITSIDGLIAAREIAQAAQCDADAAGAAAWDAARDAAWDAAWAAAGAAARAAAWDAAWAAAGAAAWDAAGAAAWDAARAAAWDAAWAAAWAAAWDAARAAAWDAAWAAAGAAAKDRLAKTVSELQDSAQQLVIRMCEVH